MLGKWEVVVKEQDVEGGEVTGDAKGATLAVLSWAEKIMGGRGREGGMLYLGSPPCRC